MAVPSRKRSSGDDDEKTNENKKRRVESTTENKKNSREDQMDESVKFFPRECPSCKSGNHKFLMFANQNYKQPRYTCLNIDCPITSYTVGGKVRQTKAQGSDVKNAISTTKVRRKNANIVTNETDGNNQETMEDDKVIGFEVFFDNNDFGKISTSSDSDDTSNYSDSNDTSNNIDYDDTSDSSDSHETSNRSDFHETLDANESMHGENMAYKYYFHDEEYEHLVVPKMTEREKQIANEVGEDYAFFKEFIDSDGEEIELLTFIEYEDELVVDS